MKLIKLAPITMGQIQTVRRDEIIKDVTEPYVKTWKQTVAGPKTTTNELWDCWTRLAQETMLLLSVSDTPLIGKGLQQLLLALKELASNRGTKEMINKCPCRPSA